MTNSVTIEIEQLLDQAAAFARGGDFLGAQARARFAAQRLKRIAASLPADHAVAVAARARVDLMIQRYDELVREWQQQVEARHTAYVTREQGAIRADSPSSPEGNRAK